MHSKSKEVGARVPDEQFQFSAPEHAMFLAGYMDAIARLLTTDAVLCGLTTRNAKEVVDGDSVYGVAIRARSSIENWSKEFGSLVEGFLRMDQRSRLGFYLVDYICWFERFTQHARCFKLDCDFVDPRTIDQSVYLLELECDFGVIVVAQHLDKMPSKQLQSGGG